jgi:hypothetical protein
MLLLEDLRDCCFIVLNDKSFLGVDLSEFLLDL